MINILDISGAIGRLDVADAAGFVEVQEGESPVQQGYVALRVGNSQVAGVSGVKYHAGNPYPVPADEDIVAFEDPVIRWTLAGKLVRELTQCTIIELP